MIRPAPAVGDMLRRLRVERQLSLAGVAAQAGVSVATLSRVETSKQTLDVPMLQTLARILGVPAGEILGEDGNDDDPATLERRLARLSGADRTKLFLDASRRRNAKELGNVLDDLLSTIDVLRDELLEVQRSVRRRKR